MCNSAPSEFPPVCKHHQLQLSKQATTSFLLKTSALVLQALPKSHTHYFSQEKLYSNIHKLNMIYNLPLKIKYGMEAFQSPGLKPTFVFTIPECYTAQGGFCSCCKLDVGVTLASLFFLFVFKDTLTDPNQIFNILEKLNK